MRPHLIVASLLLTAAAFGLRAESYSGVDRIVVVGDVHGSFDNFVAVLRFAGLIDSANKWTGGKAHLVQLGDVPDRGPDTRRVYDLLMTLGKQARDAGGRVHPLIGTHDAMNMYGDLRYVTDAEYTSFRRDTSVLTRNAFWRQHVQQLGRKPNADYRRRWEAQFPLGFYEHRFEFNPTGKYGSWIRRNEAVVKINNNLFLHGGISPAYADVTADDINSRVHRELGDLKLVDGGIVQDPEGPLWYRGLALGNEAELAGHVDAVLKRHEVARIIIGHTPNYRVPKSRFGGKVILADVGLGIAYGSNLSCLVIENNVPYVLDRGVRKPLTAVAEPRSPDGTSAGKGRPWSSISVGSLRRSGLPYPAPK